MLPHKVSNSDFVSYCHSFPICCSLLFPFPTNILLCFFSTLFSCSLFFLPLISMEEMKRIKIPAFGNWECYYDEVPITQYFDSAIQSTFFRSSHCFPNQDVDLFKVPVSPLKTQYVYNQYAQTKVKRGGERKKANGELRRQGKVYDSTAHENTTTGEYKAPKAVDEDLYKIPPELLYKKPKKKRMLRGFWSGCLGSKCVTCA